MTKTYSETINVKRIVLLKALNCSSSGMPKYRIIAEVDDGSFIELETATNSIIAYEVTNRRYKENLVISFHVTKSNSRADAQNKNPVQRQKCVQPSGYFFNQLCSYDPSSKAPTFILDFAPALHLLLVFDLLAQFLQGSVLLADEQLCFVRVFLGSF